MLYREIIAVCSEIHTKHINTLCEQNVEFVNVKSGGMYSDHRTTRHSKILYRKLNYYLCVILRHTKYNLCSVLLI